MAGLIVIATLGVLTAASTEAEARGKASGARSQSSGARGHSAGSRAHAPSVHSSSFYRGSRAGIVIGVPILLAPAWYYADPYFGYRPYDPLLVQGQEQSIVYVEQAPESGTLRPALEQQYWYYCQDSNTYFPYVQNCETPWQRVAPYAPQ